MAKKDKLKVDISVGGVRVDDLIYGKFSFENVSDKSIKQMTSRLVSAMNKRIVRLGQSKIGQLSPTYKAYEERKKQGKGKQGYFSVKGLSRSQSISLFNQLRESMSKATSLTAFKEYRSDLYERLNLEFENKTFEEAYAEDIASGKYTQDELAKLKEEYKDDEQKFWEVYREYEKDDKSNENWRSGGGSYQIISYMYNQLDWENMTIIDKINRVNELYEDIMRKRKAKEQALESGYFEDEDDFYGFDEDDDELY